MKITITEFDTDNYPSDQPRFQATARADWNTLYEEFVTGRGETKLGAIDDLLQWAKVSRDRHTDYLARQATSQHVLGTEEVTV